uniref:F-box protein SKIP23-like n=1 Tax=Elaeis guineensis var. tenera TaxID=51953 RepID=A0A6I9QAR0_ELAGV|nr:F-box protein SKIP23-like [Elaeis guineensis]
MVDHRETIITTAGGLIPLLHQEEENSSRWSDPPVDVLELILRRLGPIDHLRFGSICGSWRSARSLHRTRVDLPTPQLPWLMFGPSSSLPNGYRFEFFSLSDGRRYIISIPSRTPRQHSVIGSYANWLLTKADHKIFLINPFTRTELTLPRIIGECEGNPYLSIAVSSHPRAPYGAILVANLIKASFFYLRHGDRRWLKFLLGRQDGKLCQLVAVGGKFYALTFQRRLVDIDLDRSPVAVVVNQDGSNLGNPYGTHAFLLESDGDLLVVAMNCPNLYESTSFRIWRRNVETSSWVPMESIADRILFLGPGSPISTSAREHGVAGGRIFTIGPDSPGIYDLRTHRGEVFCSCMSSSRPTWIAPRLFYWEGRAGEKQWWDYAKVALKKVLRTLS